MPRDCTQSQGPSDDRRAATRASARLELPMRLSYKWLEAKVSCPPDPKSGPRPLPPRHGPSGLAAWGGVVACVDFRRDGLQIWAIRAGWFFFLFGSYETRRRGGLPSLAFSFPFLPLPHAAARSGKPSCPASQPALHRLHRGQTDAPPRVPCIAAVKCEVRQVNLGVLVRRGIHGWRDARGA